MTALLPPRRDVGLGDPIADADAFRQAFGQLLGALNNYRSSNPNDLLINGIISQAQTLFNQAETVGGEIHDLSAQVQQLQAQLATCQQQLAAKPATTPATTPAASTSSGVTPTTAAFIAVGAALVGGVTAYGLRGMLSRKRL